MRTPSLPPGTNAAESEPACSARIIAWPADRATLIQLQKSRIPCLVVVDDGVDPPVSSDCCQDWMWRRGNEREMRLRLRQLSLRGLEHGQRTPELDGMGMLRVGLRSIHLPAKQRDVAAVLVGSFGRPVPREELIRAAWPEGIERPNILASRICCLRPRLRWLGLEIRASRAAATYCLCTAPNDPSDQPEDTAIEQGDGFEDELVAAGWDAARWRPYPAPKPETDMTRWGTTPVVGVPGSLVGDVYTRDQGRSPWPPPTTAPAHGTQH